MSDNFWAGVLIALVLAVLAFAALKALDETTQPDRPLPSPHYIHPTERTNP